MPAIVLCFFQRRWLGPRLGLDLDLDLDLDLALALAPARDFMDAVAEFVHGPNTALILAPKLEFVFLGVMADIVHIVVSRREFQIIIVHPFQLFSL